MVCSQPFSVSGRFSQSIELSIKHVLEQHQPYLELSKRTSFVNGLLVHFICTIRRNKCENALSLHVEAPPIISSMTKTGHDISCLKAVLPILRSSFAFRPAGRHAHHLSPLGGLPAASQFPHRSNLQQRSGCKHCYTSGNAAAYWGRWQKEGGAY